MCDIHHCYHRKISQPKERERETLYLHEKRKMLIMVTMMNYLDYFPKHRG